MRRPAPALFLFACLAGSAAHAGETSPLHVRDFGAVPNDGRCDQAAIQAAIDHALVHERPQIHFDAGRYDLKIGTSSEHAGEEAYIWIKQSQHGLKLLGETDGAGKPATAWVRENPCDDSTLPSILRVYESRGITMENFKFDNAPYYNSAGRVVSKTADSVVVEILDGHPVVDGMESCQIGAYDLEKRQLLDGKISFHSSGQWQLLAEVGERTMQLDSAEVAERVKVGDGLYWFFTSFGGRQIVFEKSADILVKNLWSPGSSGFCYYFYYSRNITIDGLAIRPPPGRITTAPRDGLKFRECSGFVSIKNLHVEGTNDDGINIHGQFYRLEGPPQGRTIRMQALNKSSFPLATGSRVGFFNGAAIAHHGTIASHAFDEESAHHEIEFLEPLPDWVGPNSEAVPYATLPDSVHISNATFRNIATCGIVVKSDNTTIIDSRFETVERVGVLVLCSFYDPDIGMMEPSAANGVLIRDSTFDYVGRKYRAGKMGGLAAIATDVGRRDGASIQNVSIIGNTFRRVDNNAINVMDARHVVITENHFEEVLVDRRVYVDEFSRDVRVFNNTP